MPFITPKLCKDLVDFDGVISNDIIVVFDDCNRFLIGGERATNGGKLVGRSFGDRVIGIGCKFGVDKIEQGCTITVRGKEGVNSKMKRELFNHGSPIDLTKRISSVQDTDSVPENTVPIRFKVR